LLQIYSNDAFCPMTTTHHLVKVKSNLETSRFFYIKL